MPTFASSVRAAKYMPSFDSPVRRASWTAMSARMALGSMPSTAMGNAPINARMNSCSRGAGKRHGEAAEGEQDHPLFAEAQREFVGRQDDGGHDGKQHLLILACEHVDIVGHAGRDDCVRKEVRDVGDHVATEVAVANAAAQGIGDTDFGGLRVAEADLIDSDHRNEHRNTADH
eukprot:4012528-Prymnesium_polylepis.1